MSARRLRRLWSRLAAWWNTGLPHRVILNAGLPRRLGHDGFTLAFWTLIAGDSCDAELVAHEYRHVQHAVMGLVVGFWIAYLVEFGARILVELARARLRTTLRAACKAAYARISWERDAYAWAKRHWPSFTPRPAPARAP